MKEFLALMNAPGLQVYSQNFAIGHLSIRCLFVRTATRKA